MSYPRVNWPSSPTVCRNRHAPVPAGLLQSGSAVRHPPSAAFRLPLPILRDILPDAAKTAEPTLLADKGYDSLRFRRFVQERGFRPLLPTRSCIPPEQAVGELYAEDVTLQRKRYVVERTLGWVKGFRRLR